MLPCLLLSACGLVDQSETPCPEGDGNIRLSFRMLSSNIMRDTRADSQNHPEIDSEWPAFEDAVNEGDFAFYIFLGTGQDAPLLMKVTDIAASTDPEQMITGSTGSYTISLVIPRAELEAKLGRELDSDSSNPVDFRIVVIANARTADKHASLTADTYSGIINQANNLNFDLRDIYNWNESGDSSNDGLYKGYIPMFGTKTFSATEAELYASRPDQRIWLGEMWLLRSLAKIRVIDSMPESEKRDGFPKITRVEVSTQTYGSKPLPADAANYQDGTQVHSPNILSMSIQNYHDIKLGYLPGTGSYPLVHFGYIPEQNIADGQPVIRITAQLSAAETDVKSYDIPMTGYNGVPFTFGDAILRNHIYTLNVQSIKVGVPAVITVNVTPWTESGLNLDYTNQVGVSQRISWNESTVNGNNTAQGYVVVKPWTVNAGGQSIPVAAQCTFGISAPMGATWTAYLLTSEGAQGAFRFADAAGNQTDTFSGTVDGTLSTLRIVSTDATPSQTNSARLQIVVRLANGTYIDANICPENAAYRYYTIIQNQQ